MSKETLKLALEALKDNQHLIADNERHAYVMEYNAIIEKLEEALASEQEQRSDSEHTGEPVALKKGECWPEEVMRQWDYWRKEIANGHKGSAPRDWFEGLSELKLIDTTPQQRKPLTDEQIKAIFESNMKHDISDAFGFARAIEAAHGIKE